MSGAQPPGAVYMKNGVWLDQNDQPVNTGSMGAIGVTMELGGAPSPTPSPSAPLSAEEKKQNPFLAYPGKDEECHDHWVGVPFWMWAMINHDITGAIFTTINFKQVTTRVSYGAPCQPFCRLILNIANSSLGSSPQVSDGRLSWQESFSSSRSTVHLFW